MLALSFLPVLAEWRLLAVGVFWTLLLTAIGAVIGVALGILCAWGRVEGPTPLRLAIRSYVELIRNTPFIVQLFFIFFGLPAWGLRLPPEVAAMIAMVINLGAYATEIVRAGVAATPRGQIEAALSLSLTRPQVYFHVVLPPALARVWPALVSQIIIVMLGSAVCGQISVEELSWAANLIHSRNFRAFEALLIATAIYFVLTITVRRLLNWIGPRFLFGH